MGFATVLYEGYVMNFKANRESRTGSPRMRWAIGFGVFLIALGVVASSLFASPAGPATAATVSFSQCNNRGPGPGGAPLSVTCSVNIVNSITPTGNTSSATFTRICTLNACTGDVINASDVVSSVSQCNGSDNVGGSTMVCSVNITNNILVNAPAATSAVTVNQCVGSGGGGGTDMSACIPSAQGSPTVVQCNGSGNGGGGKMTCNASGTTSVLFPVTVNQCNGSENGGGSFVTCTSQITTNISVVQIPTATPTLVVGVATPTPIPGQPIATPTPIPGQPIATPTPLPGQPVATPVGSLPPVFLPPQQPPVLFPPQQPPVFFPPQPPLVVVPPVVIPPVAPPVTIPPVATPVIEVPPVSVPPAAVPPVQPPLPPETPIVYPPAQPGRPQTGVLPPETPIVYPPSSGDGGLVRPDNEDGTVWSLPRTVRSMGQRLIERIKLSSLPATLVSEVSREPLVAGR